jgi:hypothetical protein
MTGTTARRTARTNPTMIDLLRMLPPPELG